MNKLLLFTLLVALGCSTTKRQLRQSFAKVFFLDTGYFEVPIRLDYHEGNMANSLRDSLVESGALKFVSSFQQAGRSVHLYEVTDSGKKYFVKIRYPDIYDTTKREAIFNYYRLESATLMGYSFLNKRRDSVRATIKSTYSVTPIFPIDETDRTTYPVFKKVGETWELVDKRLAIGEIYMRNKDRSEFRSIYMPLKLFHWFRYNDSLTRHNRDSLY